LESISIDDLIKNCIKIIEPRFLNDSKKQSLFLISQIAGIPYTKLLIPDIKLQVDNATADKIYLAARRSLNNEPLQYITGKAYFMNEIYSVGKGVLIPRKDTEILVEEAFNILRDKSNVNILEFCTGSGCIIISLAKMLDKAKCEYRAIATEFSEEAICFAKRNLSKNKTKFPVKIINHDIMHDDIYDIKTFCGKYDMIISNPPYIKSSEIQNLEPRVSCYEPHMALDGGQDGLDFYKKIAIISEKLLEEGGCLLLEIGYDQYEQVKDILQKSGIFEEISYKKDYSGNFRVVAARRV